MKCKSYNNIFNEVIDENYLKRLKAILHIIINVIIYHVKNYSNFGKYMGNSLFSISCFPESLLSEQK